MMASSTLMPDVDKAAMICPSAAENCEMKDFQNKLSQDHSQSQDFKDSKNMEQVNGSVLKQVKTESDEDPIWACYSSFRKEWDKDVPGIKTEDLWVKPEPTELNKGDFRTCGDSFSTDSPNAPAAVKDGAAAKLGQTVTVKGESRIWENIWTCYNSVLGNEDQRTVISVKHEHLPFKRECRTPNVSSADEYLKTVYERNTCARHSGEDTTSQTFQSPLVSREQKDHGNVQNGTFSRTYPDSSSCAASVSSAPLTTPTQDTLPTYKTEVLNQQKLQPPVKERHVLQPNTLPKPALRCVQGVSQPQSLGSAAPQVTSQGSPVQHNLPNPSSSRSILKQAHQNWMQTTSHTTPVTSSSPASENCPQPGRESLGRSQVQQPKELNMADPASFRCCHHCQKTILSHYEEGGRHKLPKSAKSKNAVRNWKCCKCDVAISTVGRFMYHLMKKHGASSYVCKVCGTSFDSNKKLKYHMYVHDSPVSCTVCGKVYRSRLHLRNHSRIHREDLVRFFCELCGKGFRFKTSLQTHMNVHTNERPHKCPDCKASFKAHGHLLRHRLMHTDSRPFPCSVCQNAFRTRANLRAHLKTHDKDPERERGTGTRGNGKRKRTKVLLSESEEEEEEWQGEDSEVEEHGEESEEDGAEGIQEEPKGE
ncbi:hypothetical protein NFI96_017158 [Prochilodus magdalenae]|nr:hypothetical protein NFI96_017158 [Prochilodus magdalenae]